MSLGECIHHRGHWTTSGNKVYFRMIHSTKFKVQQLSCEIEIIIELFTSRY